MRALIAIVFLLLAAWFLGSSRGVRWELQARTPVLASELAAGVRRTTLGDPPTVNIGGYDQRCSQCHALFESGPRQKPELLQHTHVRLAHGTNDNCMDCHARADRDRLVLRSGELIGYAQSPQLCGQCHGPTWRDWQKGIHGRTEGSWESSSPLQRRAACVECHDPHAPAFPGIPPLPGPRTWRMGEPERVEPHPVVSPLDPRRHADVERTHR